MEFLLFDFKEDVINDMWQKKLTNIWISFSFLWYLLCSRGLSVLVEKRVVENAELPMRALKMSGTKFRILCWVSMLDAGGKMRWQKWYLEYRFLSPFVGSVLLRNPNFLMRGDPYCNVWKKKHLSNAAHLFNALKDETCCTLVMTLLSSPFNVYHW